MTLVFNHIPKTAGSSFRALLKRQYKSLIFEIADDNLNRDVKFFLNFSIKQQNEFEVISGHCSQFCDRNLLDKKSIVFLRNPFDQMMSTYYQIRKNPNNMWHQVSKKCVSVLEVTNFIEDYGLNNLQTRFLASDSRLLFFLETKGIVMNQLDDSDFELALKNLKDTHLVGLTEHFDKSVIYFKKKLDWETPFYTKSNKTASIYKLKFNEEDLEEVKRVQFYDEKIYSEAVKIFNKSLIKSNINDIELLVFRINNYSYNLINRLINKLQRIS